MSNGNLGKNQLLGQFVVGDQFELNGLLTLSDEGVSLYVWDTNMIDVTRMTAEIYGRLHDNRVATLFDCVLPTRPGFTLGANHGTSRATIVPNNVVFGPDRFAPSSELIDRVVFRTDDTNLLFNDRSAFRFKPGTEDDPSIHAKYSGEDSIFSIDTSMGRISASHNIQDVAVLDVSDGVEISTKVYFEIVFTECLSYHDAIRRVRSVISFVALLMGRPQNLVEMSVIARSRCKSSVKRKYDVDCTMFPKYVRVGDSDRTRAFWADCSMSPRTGLYLAPC